MDFSWFSFRPALPLLFAAAGAGFWSGCSRESEGITLRYLDAPDPTGTWAELIREFEAANPGIRIEREEGPPATDAREAQIATTFLSGSSPYDLVYMDISWVAKFASQGWLMPLDSLAGDDSLDWREGDRAGSRYEGRLYRLPVQSDVGLLYYRRDWLDSAGMQPPATWEALGEQALALAPIRNAAGFVFQGKQYEGLACNFFEFFHSRLPIGEDPEASLRPDALQAHPEAALEALQWLEAGVGQGFISSGVLTYQEEESRRVFADGGAVFLRNWPYAWPLLVAEGSPLQGKVGLAPLPRGEGGASHGTLGGWGFALAAGTPHAEACLAFVRHLQSGASQIKLLEGAGLLPASVAAYRDSALLISHPELGAIDAALASARARPSHARYPAISEAVQQAAGSVLSGSASAEAAAAALHKETAFLAR